MKRNSYFIVTGIAIIAIAGFLIYKSLSHQRIKIDPGFSEYISAFTSGTISSQSSIRIELVKEMDAIEVNSEIDKKLFSFSPSISGKAYWVDNRTIEFRPDKPLKQNTRYVAEFYLKKLMEVPKKFKVFEFDFQTIQQAIELKVDGYEPYIFTSLDWNAVSGTITTADVADEASVEKILKASQNKKDLKVTWVHNTEAKTHRFKVDSVHRVVEPGEVLLEWDGSKIDADKSGEEVVKIPSINDFTVIEGSVVQEPQQYVSIRFSDPLDPKQDLNGLITLSNGTDVTFEIDRMFIKVYPASRQTGTITVNILEGIKNVAGGKLKDEHTIALLFESIKPAVRLLGKGVILPSSKGLILPFEAVNVKAVDLRVIKIFENNVAQFLQVNQLDGQYELNRAGRLILKKTIKLDALKPISFNKWNTFSIDLADLIKQEPGAIYRIQFSIRKDYSTYPCSGDEKTDDKEKLTSIADASEEESDEDAGYWDRVGNYYNENYDDEYDGDYRWEERDDPCKSAYYTSENAKASRNLLASNLGIIAKGTSNNTISVAIADLISTKPKSGVEVEVYNYQHQKIGNAKTDGDGFCTLALKNKPFLLVAKDGDQRGYLRIDDGSALSLSNFDVSGEVVQKGLKGLIYGERGVWRPGDTVYLTFVLEDILKKLPENHPVTLEILNPQGQLYKRIVKTSGVHGFYHFVFTTGEDDPTGNWMAYIKMGGTTFSKTVKIETIKPNRLKILFDFGTDLIKGSSAKASLNVKWLHGAPGRNMKAVVAVTLSSAKTSFKGFDNFEFDDPVKKFETEEKNIFEGNLNDNGDATVSAGISVNRNAPGMLRANFVTRVFEPGGEFSIDRLAVPYSPYDSYVGIKPPEDRYGWLLTDTTQFFDLATVSADGKPISRSNLEFKIYKMEWRWWWDSNVSELANFETNTHAREVFSTRVSTSNGKGRVAYKLSYPDWGRFLVRVTDPVSGHSTGRMVYYDWPGWRGRAARGDAKGATMLSFSADKKSYNVGDKATITVPSSEGGRILVSLETGSEVLKTWWVETKARETKASFEVTEKMAPNVYINVSLIQPHAQCVNDLPMRLYGVLPVKVENPATHLYPLINMPEVMEPEKPVTIKVSEKNNHSMTYTLAIVDEGLLDITRFKTPDPWTSFYGREALGVKTWDLYDMVMGAFGGKIESLFAIGGDDNLKGGAGQKANRFKPVVKVLGPFFLKSGTNKHEIKLPQYVGSVRVMVVAADDQAFGNTEKTVPVRMPLMVLATLPRVVGPGEELTLPVTVFAMEKKIKNFTVEVIPNEFFQLLDGRTKDMSVKEVGEFDLSFRLKVASREGVGRVKVIVRSGNDKSEYDMEINVRNPNSKMVQYTDAVVEAGQTANVAYNLIGMTGTNKATLEVSSIPAIDLSRRLGYLLDYPYGCVEQTTSAAFPQLYLQKFIDLDAYSKTRRDANINYAINRLNSMMLPDGGIGYWPGAAYANDWGTSYAGHFMIEAENKGYSLPSGFRTNWLKYQRTAARNWNLSARVTYVWDRYDLQLQQAYRLYTLALAKEPEMGAMNRMKEMSGLFTPAAWRLAAAYALAGQPEVAKQIIDKAGTEIKTYGRFTATFGSMERDWAMMLETLSLLNQKTEAFVWVKKVAASLSSEQWMSTQSTAYGLLAISKFLDGNNESHEVKFTYSGGGKTNVHFISQVPVAQIKLDAHAAGAGKVTISNTGKGILFARVVTEGIPETGPAIGFENNLKLGVQFKMSDGSAIDISRLQQGTDFVAEVTVRNTYGSGGISNMALKQVFPSGWEIASDRMDKEGVTNTETNNFTYQDVRDDRVFTFFDVGLNASTTFKVRLNASYTGRFYFPGTLVEAMYEPGINAFVPGKWVEVVK